ncbi:MAG: DUF3604 domain-containing protein [Armatimonadota bacterium]
MDAYPNANDRRLIIPEIEKHIADKTNSTLVYGFSEILETGDAIVGGERVAGFMETHDRREWYYPLSATHGLSWNTQPVPATSLPYVSFLFSTGFGNGSPLPQPSGSWDVYVNDRHAVSIRVVKHSQLWHGDQCSLAFAANRIESAEPFGSISLSSVITDESFAAFGPALLTVPSSWLQLGTKAQIRVESRAEAESKRWFHLATTPMIVNCADIYQAVDLLTTNRIPKVGQYNVYFGDIHTHSGEVDGCDDYSQGCGMGSRKENYDFARGAGGLDFYALTDHEYQINENRISDYMELADNYNEDGRFVCLPAFEFTSLLYGHRNVYFKDSGGTIINSTRGWGGPTFDPDKAVSPEELWSALDEVGVQSITIPHHPSATSHPCSWSFYNPKYDRLVEIYSCWGSSEYYGDFPRGVSDRYRTLNVRDALKRGLRMGFAASADGHDGHPGDAQSPMIKHHHIFHHLGSGLTAVLCNDLTRASVFDALYNRRCYATTGVPMVLSFDINGMIMGSEIPSLPNGQPPVLNIQCKGTNGIDHIRIVKNGTVAETIFCHGEHEYQYEWVDSKYAAGDICNYYIRIVQVDKESAWSSPIWIG